MRNYSGSLPTGAKTRRSSGNSTAVIPSGFGIRSCKTVVAESSLDKLSSRSPATWTDASLIFALRPYPNSARQRNSAVVASWQARATAETDAPGRSHFSTMASFFSLVKWRRCKRPSCGGSAFGLPVKALSTLDSLAALLALDLSARQDTMESCPYDFLESNQCGCSSGPSGCFLTVP